MDAQRQETRISLFDVQLGGTFDQSLFAFIDPKFFGNNRDDRYRQSDLTSKRRSR